MWERGLKLGNVSAKCKPSLSLPMWERGLKLRQLVSIDKVAWSLPMWERGLKPPVGSLCMLVHCRSPCGSVD